MQIVLLLLFFSRCAAAFCGGRTRKSGWMRDLPDRSPGLARVHACAKDARGWGWAEEKHLFVPRSWRRCDPTTRALLLEVVKDRAVGYGGMVSPLYRRFLLHLMLKNVHWNSAQPCSPYSSKSRSWFTTLAIIITIPMETNRLHGDHCYAKFSVVKFGL